MKRFLLMSIMTVVLVGVASCGGSGSNGEDNESVSTKLEETIDEAVSQADSISADKDTIDQAESKVAKKNDSKAKFVVIDFFATWCGPCRAMAPTMEKMEKKYSDKIEFRKVDVDQDPEQAQQYQIQSIPTLIILSSKGEVLNKIVGAKTEDYLDKIFSNL